MEYFHVHADAQRLIQDRLQLYDDQKIQIGLWDGERSGQLKLFYAIDVIQPKGLENATTRRMMLFETRLVGAGPAVTVYYYLQRHASLQRLWQNTTLVSACEGLYPDFQQIEPTQA